MIVAVVGFPFQMRFGKRPINIQIQWPREDFREPRRLKALRPAAASEGREDFLRFCRAVYERKR